MTRYKKYLKEKGFKLEDDFDYLPYNGIEEITTFIAHGTIRIKIIDNRIGIYGYVIFKDGEILGIDPE